MIRATAGVRLGVALIGMLGLGLLWPQAAPFPGSLGLAQGAAAGQGPTRDAAPESLQAASTGSISGTVVSADSAAPVRRARVTLSGGGGGRGGGRATLTDDNGAFSLVGLPAGRYTVTVSKAGYIDIAYGARSPGRPGVPIQLSEGQELERLSLTLPRGGVLTGIVLDQYGEPAPGTQVRAMRFVLQSGERSLQTAGQDQTDDRGIYRIYGLQPGDYMVSATPRNENLGALAQTMLVEAQALAAQGAGLGLAFQGGGRGAVVVGGRGQALLDQASAFLQDQQTETMTTYAPVYYPGTSSPSGATAIVLGVSEERVGVDFQLQLVPTTRVTGLIVGANGEVPQGTQVALVRSDLGGLENVPGLGSSRGRVGGDGRFTFQNVTPGQYSLQARAIIREQTPEGEAPDRGGRGRGGRGGAIAEVLWAAADVSIGGGVPMPDVVLSLQPGMNVSGRLEFEGDPASRPEDLTTVQVSLDPRGSQLLDIGQTPQAVVEADGRFAINGVPPGTYAIEASLGRGGGRGGRGAAAQSAPSAVQWSLKSAVVAGRDTLDVPLVVSPNESIGGAVVTFSSHTQGLSGTLQDGSGRPNSDFTIVIFPVEQRYWTPQSRRIASARPATDGRFTFSNLPAGEYRLTAITDAEPGQWYDPAFLAQLVGASIPVSLAEGQSRVQDIRLAN